MLTEEQKKKKKEIRNAMLHRMSVEISKIKYNRVKKLMKEKYPEIKMGKNTYWKDILESTFDILGDVLESGVMPWYEINRFPYYLCVVQCRNFNKDKKTELKINVGHA